MALANSKKISGGKGERPNAKKKHKASRAEKAASRKRHEERVRKKRQVAVWLERETHFATIDALAEELGIPRSRLVEAIVEEALAQLTPEICAYFARVSLALKSSCTRIDADAKVIQYFREIQRTVQTEASSATSLLVARWNSENATASTKSGGGDAGDITAQAAPEVDDLDAFGRSLGLEI